MNLLHTLLWHTFTLSPFGAPGSSQINQEVVLDFPFFFFSLDTWAQVAQASLEFLFLFLIPFRC